MSTKDVQIVIKTNMT